MSATFAVKKKCCCADEAATYFQGFDCKDSLAALPIYVRSGAAPGDLYYQLGGYCVQFGDTPVTELPTDATVVDGSHLTDSFETCEECSPDGCPTDNDLCGTTFLATITFPVCADDFDDMAVSVVPQGNGTWLWENEFDETENLTIFCDGGYWIAQYHNPVACAGVTFRWRTIRSEDCPGPTEPDDDPGQWEFIDESNICCTPGSPTFTTSLP
jgi:hypothetical protein